MKNKIHQKIKLSLIFVLVIILAFNLTSCWSQTELNQLAIVAGIAMDKGNNPNEMELTFQVLQPAGLKTEIKRGGELKPYYNITNTGLSVFSTIRGFTHESSRKMYLPHNQILIFGNDAAKNGLEQYMDFYIREPENRTSVWVLVAEDKAIEILQTPTSIAMVPAVNISDMVEAQRATSQTSVVNLQHFISRLMSKTTAPIASWIDLKKEPEGKNIHHLSGTAVFKKDKLIGRLDETETRGLNWVLGEIHSGIIVIQSPSGEGLIELEITEASSEISSEMQNGELSIKVKIKEMGSMGAQTISDNLLSKEGVAYLEQCKETAIRSEIMDSIKKAKELNADIFGFGEAVHKKYPKEWKWLEGEWSKLFSDLHVEIDIETKVERSGMISKTVVSH